jgi:tetraacyldisaccharide 4'-kinase
MNPKEAIKNIWNNDRQSVLLYPLIFFLALSARIYRWFVNLRNRLYDLKILKQEKLPCKVISVGNITVGGTGKTPTVIMIAKLLKTHGYRPAVLSRGYGGESKNPVNIVSDGRRLLMGYTAAGDEPVMIAKSIEGVPVLTGPKRILTGKTAIKKMGVNVLVLDDAFQHRNIFRDIDIVLLNEAKPFGNGQFLPRGPLREPPDALKRADIVILTGDNNALSQDVPPEVSSLPVVFKGCYKPTAILQGGTNRFYPPDYLADKKFFAFAGIGSPDVFQKTLASLGGNLIGFISFPDHYRYADRDMDAIQKKFVQSGADIMITTQKDHIKLTDFPEFEKNLHVLIIDMDITPSETHIENLILGKLAS